MNILAVDFGTKRIGLAWTNIEVGVVLPFGIVEAPSMERGVRELAELIDKEKIDKVVIGLPLNLEGKENLNTERVRKFVKELENSIGVPVDFFDERFSSGQADAMGQGVTRDEKAAMVILDGYLQRKSFKK